MTHSPDGGEIDTESAFAPIDDVMKALESLPGIDDDRTEREAAQTEWESAEPGDDNRRQTPS